jgi:ABC-type polysaccharide/polyol phosphate transport system ATPase subunit
MGGVGFSFADEHFEGKCVDRSNEFLEQGQTTVFGFPTLG